MKHYSSKFSVVMFVSTDARMLKVHLHTSMTVGLLPEEPPVCHQTFIYPGSLVEIQHLFYQRGVAKAAARDNVLRSNKSNILNKHRKFHNKTTRPILKRLL